MNMYHIAAWLFIACGIVSLLGGIALAIHDGDGESAFWGFLVAAVLCLLCLFGFIMYTGGSIEQDKELNQKRLVESYRISNETFYSDDHNLMVRFTKDGVTCTARYDLEGPLGPVIYKESLLCEAGKPSPNLERTSNAR